MPVPRLRDRSGLPARAAAAIGKGAGRLARTLWRGLLLAGAAAAAMLLLAAGVAAYYLYTLPLPTDFREPERPALRLAAADGSSIAVRGAFHGNRVTLSELPPYLVAAVVTMEDRRFFEHHGVDPKGLLRAAYANLVAGEIVQGGSTITQQVARLEFLSAERTFTRKIQEALLALWLERRLTKEEILTRYLNAIYLGAGAYGVDAASRRYFGKPAREASLAEAAQIVGLIPAPSRFAPTTSPEAAERRAALVLDTMVAAGRLEAAAAAEAKANPAQLQLRPAEKNGFGYLADWVAAEARQRLEGVSGDFRVSTTIDPRLQELAVLTVDRWLQAEGAEAEAGQAALVALRPSGEVLALVGGADYTTSQFNRAIQARRQPGSAFKLFVYLAALQEGRDPDSLIVDAPIRIKKWSPQNYSNRFFGRTTLRAAFARSLNAATVRLQEEVGRERVIAQAQAMGIASPLEPNPSLALGTEEVSLLELTAAYAAVSAGRSRVTPFVLKALEGRGGARLTVAQPESAEPLAAREAMLSLLREVVESGTGKRAELPVASFGKTGTSQDHRDAWFVGFAEDLVVGVWVGNDDRSPMKGVTGGRLPAKIWQSFMAAALSSQSAEELIAALPEAVPAAPPATPPAPSSPEPQIAVAEDSAPAAIETAAPPLPDLPPAAIPQPPPAAEAASEAPESPEREIAQAEDIEPKVAAPQAIEPEVVELEVIEPKTAEAEVVEPEVAEQVAEAPPVAPPVSFRPRRKPQRPVAAQADVTEEALAEAAVPPAPRPRPKQRASTPKRREVAVQATAEPAAPPPPLPRRRPRDLVQSPKQIAGTATAKPSPPAPRVAAMPEPEPAPAPPPKLTPKKAPAGEPRAAKMPKTQPAPAPTQAPRPAPPPEVQVTELPKTRPAPSPTQAPRPAPLPEVQVAELPKTRPAPSPTQAPRPAPLPEVQVAELPKAQPAPRPSPPQPAPQVVTIPEPDPAPAPPPKLTPRNVPAGEPRVTALPKSQRTDEPAPKRRERLVGIPAIHDTGTLQIGPHWVHLEGVKGTSGPAVREMAKYIGSREVTCTPTSGRRYRCEVDGWDLSEVVLFNGGGRAMATASADLVAAEHDARQARRGLWGR